MNNLGIEVLFDKIIVEPLQMKQETHDGLILPTGVKHEAKRGKVLAVGTGENGADLEAIACAHQKGYKSLVDLLKNESAIDAAKYLKGCANTMSMKVGDTVLYGEYSSTPTRVKKKSVLIMRETDIFAVTKE